LLAARALAVTDGDGELISLRPVARLAARERTPHELAHDEIGHRARRLARRLARTLQRLCRFLFGRTRRRARRIQAPPRRLFERATQQRIVAALRGDDAADAGRQIKINAARAYLFDDLVALLRLRRELIDEPHEFLTRQRFLRRRRLRRHVNGTENDQEQRAEHRLKRRGFKNSLVHKKAVRGQ
jgi:hypothetical protein